jgi:hypothetical protein
MTITERRARGERPGKQVGALKGGSSRFSLQLHAENGSMEQDAFGCRPSIRKGPPLCRKLGDAGITALAWPELEARRERTVPAGHEDRKPRH